MAVLGSIDILTKLVGGQQVLNQLNQIKAAGQQLGSKPINVAINASGLQASNANLQNISRTLTGFSQSWDKSLQGIARFSDGLTHAGQVAATFAYRMTLLTAPIDILIGKSLQFTTELEYSLAKAATQLDGTLDRIRQFASESKAITLDLQSQYGVNAQDISSALYYQVSSGVSAAQAQAALPILTQLAAASQTKPDIASQALTAALNVFREELSQIPDLATRASTALEILWAATKKGRFEFTDFATQFGRSAGQAEAAGLTLSETAAMLASLSQVFTASQSSTSLNSFMKAFIDQTKEAKEAFKALKIDIYEVVDGVRQRRPGMDVFLETIRKLQGVYQQDAKLGDELTSALFGDIRGGRAAQFFLDPAQVDNLLKMEGEIRNATGGIARDWELMSKQIQTVINQTIGMFFKFGDSVVKYLEPTIRGALAGIQVFLTSLTASPQAAQIFAQIAASLAIAAPAALLFATALMGVGGLITAIATLMTPAYLIGFSLLVGKLAPAFTAAMGAVDGFGGGIKGILGLVTEVAFQLGLISNTDRMKVFDQLGIQAKTIAREASGVRAFVTELRNLGNDAMRIADGIKAIAEGVAQLIDNISKGKGALGFIVNAGRGVLSAGEGLLNNVSNATGIGGSSGIAQVADVAIGGILAAKLGATLLSALSKLTVTTQNVAAGVVNIAGLPGSAVSALGAATGVGGALSVATIAATAILALEYLGIRAVANQGAQERAEQNKPSNFSDAFFQGLNSAGDAYVKWHAEFNAKFYEVVGNIVNGLIAFLQTAAAASLQNATTIAASILRVGIEATVRGIAAGILNAVRQAIPGAIANFIKLPDWVDRNVGGLFGFPYIQMTAGGAAAPTTVSGMAGARLGIVPRTGASIGGVDAGLKQATQQAAFNVGAFGDAAKKAASAADEAARRAKEAAEKFRSAIENLVKAALASTSVTDADLQAAAEGRYVDKADEFARRTRAVATGTDPSIYGEEYLEQLKLAQSKMPGASMDELAEAFGDRSLFARMTPDEIDKMWNWDAVVASVRRGIDRIVGEWKLMKTAVAEVMAQLSQDELASLKEALGLSVNTSLEDVTASFLAETTGLGGKIADVAASVKGTIDEGTTTLFSNFAALLERIRQNSNIVVTVSVDETLFAEAQGRIEELETKIQDKVTAAAKRVAGAVGAAATAGLGGAGGGGIGRGFGGIAGAFGDAAAAALDGVANAGMGFLNLGRGKGDYETGNQPGGGAAGGAAQEPPVSAENLAILERLAELLERIKANSNIIITISLDEAMIAAVQKRIEELFDLIQEKLDAMAGAAAKAAAKVADIPTQVSENASRVFPPVRIKDDTAYPDLSGRGKGDYETGKQASEGEEPPVSLENLALLNALADVLERIKEHSNIILTVAFNDAAWEKAKEKILEAEEFIKEHLLAYADVFIQITAKFTAESGGGGGEYPMPPNATGKYFEGGAGKGDYGTPLPPLPPPYNPLPTRATGGYVGDGIYKVGEEGYEYVLPHPLTKWIEGMMGGRINSPNDIMWLIQALTSPGGKAEALAKSADWAATQHGEYYEMPPNYAKWIDRIKVWVDDERLSLDDALWRMGNPAALASKGGGAGGGGTGGTGGGGDLTALKSTLESLIAALNRLTRALDAMSRAGMQTPQPVSDFVGGGGGSPFSNTSNEQVINFYGNIVAPNGATIDSLYGSIMDKVGRRTTFRANLGQA